MDGYLVLVDQSVGLGGQFGLETIDLQRLSNPLQVTAQVAPLLISLLQMYASSLHSEQTQQLCIWECRYVYN